MRTHHIRTSYGECKQVSLLLLHIHLGFLSMFHGLYAGFTISLQTVFHGPISVDKVSVAVRFFPLRFNVTRDANKKYILSHKNHIIRTLGQKATFCRFLVAY